MSGQYGGHHHGHSHAHSAPSGPRDPEAGFSEHHHGDSRTGHHAESSGSRPLVVAVALTGAYALVELIGGLWSGSLALLADSGHLATDAAALLFSLAANRIAQRPASEKHSFGLARAEVIAAFVNSLALLAVVVWLVIEGVERIRRPVPVNGIAVVVIATTTKTTTHKRM